VGTQYLIDSNVVIDYLGSRLPNTGMTFMNEIVNDIPKVSVITKIEVLGFNTTPEANQLLTNFFDDAIILSITNEVEAKTIELRKNHKIKLPDAIIAATALVNNYSLITRNLSDFEKIEGIALVNPYEYNY